MEHLSLYELNQLIGKVLNSNLEPSYWVVAEIGEIKINQKGHCYLELVEKKDDQLLAKTRATIWSYTYRNLISWFEGITGETLKPGLKILMNATVQYHEIYGLSLNIRDIDAQFTLGERVKRKNEIIAKLKGDGIFDMNRSLPLPKVPQNVAVISSPNAAGFGDFMDQLKKNPYRYQFYVKLFQATMQGQDAEQSIINAMLQVFEQVDQFDLLVIIRGGGAAVDLDCFDTYDLASHIAQFPKPVLTGIGHERDETIADLVAHTKMKTPTAVAEFLISGMHNFEESLEDFLTAISAYVSGYVEFHHKELSRKFRTLNSVAGTNTTRFRRLLDQRWNKTQFFAKRLLDKKYNLLAEHKEKIRFAPRSVMTLQKDKIQLFSKALSLLDPKNVLERGYSITSYKGRMINKKMSIEPGVEISTETKDLFIRSVVSKVQREIKK